ncbi:MAG TPA: cupin domain-containing protein [Steroidobacteraceae bacterium]|nr:cupin domain-containing protein [Steroidobacteraceae bacterium]
MSKRIDPSKVIPVTGTDYPKPHDAPCLRRERKKLGGLAKLTQFGVNLLRLPPGVWSSQRHWHTGEDEFVFVVEGEVVLVTDDGEEILRPGDCAGFKANDSNGHHLQNRSKHDAVVLEIGSRDERDGTFYSDVDMRIDPGSDRYTRRDGSPI